MSAITQTITQPPHTKPFTTRTVTSIIDTPSHTLGNSFNLRAVVQQSHTDTLYDPVLLLDHFNNAIHPDRPAGAGDHPHRGFEIITYLLPDSTGSLRHEDDAGNTGILTPGSIQWLNTGRGIMHNEGPEVAGHINGFQLWINVPSNQRLSTPGYTDYTPLDVTEVQQDGIRVRVISGTALGATSQAKTSSQLIFLHYYIKSGSTVQQSINTGDNAFVYVIRGEIQVSGEIVKVGQRAYTQRNDNRDGIEIINTSTDEAEFVILGGTPAQQRTVTWGPFVGNNEQDIINAFQEYKAGTNGFEAAPTWKSRWNYLVNKGRRRYTEAPELNADGTLPPFEAKKYILSPIAA